MLQSIANVPLPKPAERPLSPKSTSSTAAVSLTQRMTTSVCCANFTRSLLGIAPASTSSFILLGVRFHTATPSPALRRSCAMPLPRIPSPTKPILSLIQAPHARRELIRRCFTAVSHRFPAFLVEGTSPRRAVLAMAKLTTVEVQLRRKQYAGDTLLGDHKAMIG